VHDTPNLLCCNKRPFFADTSESLENNDISRLQHVSLDGKRLLTVYHYNDSRDILILSRIRRRRKNGKVALYRPPVDRKQVTYVEFVGNTIE